MLGKKQRHCQNISHLHRPPQDVAVPQRISSPRTSDISLEVFNGSTPELKYIRRPRRDRRAYKMDSNDSHGGEGETNTFIPRPAESPPPPCCPSLSQVWNTSKAIFCCLITCGSCFKDCRASISYNNTLTEDGKNQECNGRSTNSPANSSPNEKNGSRTEKSTVGSSFSYPDVKFKGVPVPLYPNRNPSSATDSDSCYKEPLPERFPQHSIEKQPAPTSHRSSEEHYSFHESDLEFGELNSSMSSREIDGLIFRKLTELFSVHQIDELAKCTSDTAFLEKTNKISDLINSITQDYNLDEQDAECRLVRGIIRISTRKSRVRPRVPAPNLPSSGEITSRGNPLHSANETMLASVLTSEEGMHELQF